MKTNNMKPLKGIIPPLVTPLKNENNIDEQGLILSNT
jgi:dihydrodipicolinate synthase/N-acetylneuraminate lyase